MNMGGVDGMIDEVWTNFEPNWQATGLIGANQTDLYLPPCSSTVRVYMVASGPNILSQSLNIGGGITSLVQAHRSSTSVLSPGPSRLYE